MDPAFASSSMKGLYGGFPKLGVHFLEVPIIRTIVYLGSILVSPDFGKLPYGGCPIFLYLKTTLSPCLSRTFRGLSRPRENPQKLHLRTIKAYMLTHIILPFRRAFADLSRPQKSTDFASHMFGLYIKCKQGF